MQDQIRHYEDKIKFEIDSWDRRPRLVEEQRVSHGGVREAARRSLTRTRLKLEAAE